MVFEKKDHVQVGKANLREATLVPALIDVVLRNETSAAMGDHHAPNLRKYQLRVCLLNDLEKTDSFP